MTDSDLHNWIGRSETLADTIAPIPARAMAASLGIAGPDAEGDTLPPLWHWLYFLPLHARQTLGPDGHAARGGFLPPISLPRRMWAGSRFQFHQPLRLGESARRSSQILDVVSKQGRSGHFVLVTVQHEIYGESGLAITEQQDLAYREAAVPGAPSSTAAEAPARPDWSHDWVADPVLLFRYSALTFNSHRIHYDAPYATNVEGYPGLVVHGPLIMTLLLQSLLKAHPERRIESASLRAVRPLFQDTPFALQGRLEDNGAQALLWCLDAEGAVTMHATVTLQATA